MKFEQSPIEYFKDLVEAAIKRQHVKTDKTVEFYLVNLLVNRIESEKLFKHDEPLAITFGKAFQASLTEQEIILRHVGDISLYLCGFFSESLTRKLVAVDYYISIGKMSYSYLANLESGMVSRKLCSSLYKELSKKFLSLTDVLAEVSERCSLTSNENILRLYEKWIRTRNEWTAELLREKGIEPLQDISSAPIH